MTPEELFEIYSKAIKALDGMVSEFQAEALLLHLDDSDVAIYEETASELKKAILQKPPDVSDIYRLIGILSFLGSEKTDMQVKDYSLYLAGRMGPYIPQFLHFTLLYLKEEVGYGRPSES